MTYRQQPVPTSELLTAIHWEKLRAGYFERQGRHPNYKAARVDALMRVAGHLKRLQDEMGNS